MENHIAEIRYVHLTQCAKLLSAHHEENFKHVPGIELVNEVILFGSIFIYLFLYLRHVWDMKSDT